MSEEHVDKRTLAGKVVVITGASSGFGKGAALAFAREGASVVVAARRDELIEELARACRAESGHALAVPTDVSIEKDVEHLAEMTLQRYGSIDIWINNAGVGAIGHFEDIPLDIHAQVIRTTLLGTVYGSYYAYREFVRQGHGTLINIGSELGKHTVPYYASYAAAKHGVVGLSQSLRQEIDVDEQENIHVCLVMPTAHDTPFFDHAANYTGHAVNPPDPLHDPQDVVDTLVALARNPKDTKIVGRDGIAKVLLQKLLPPVAERMGAVQMHKTQYEDAPIAGDSPGAVLTPTEEGTEVSAGRRANRS